MSHEEQRPTSSAPHEGALVRLLAVSGSLRAESSNTAVLEAVGRLAPPGVVVELWDDLGRLPWFNPDLDGDDPPPVVRTLRERVGAADGLLISSPEYAHGVPGALKNALDWLVGSVEFPGKPVVLINPSPRSRHAQAALREILDTMSASLQPEADVVIRLTGRRMDPAAIAADEELARQLRRGLARLLSGIDDHRALRSSAARNGPF